MPSFNDIQIKLNRLLPLPGNLPVVYLLGDTGAGKTCVVRQLLGTTSQKFPSVKRFRTTVAPTEFIITNEPELKAAFVFKEEEEVSRNVTEILEQAVSVATRDREAGEQESDLVDILGISEDERFKLGCFLSESVRENLAKRITAELVPRLHSWIRANFPNEEDHVVGIELALEDEFRLDIDNLRDEIMQNIRNLVYSCCGLPSAVGLPLEFSLVANDRREFVEKLKQFLSVDEGSISPVIEKARIRGALRSAAIPKGCELVIIDGEGIGHDAKESRVLSARHMDYFNISDALILVEDSEKPFTAGGKSALNFIAKTGQLPKLCLAFSRLDRVETEREGKQFQKRKVEQSLRNVLHALRDEDTTIEKGDMDIRYFSNMDQAEPDQETRQELTSLLSGIEKKHGQAKARFVPPDYDFELLAAFLAQATTELRSNWAGYIQGEHGVRAEPWQRQKAFTFRMTWRRDEYKNLQPVAEFTERLISKTHSFISNPQRWADEISEAHKKNCLDQLKQEISRQMLAYVREELLNEEHDRWTTAAAGLSGKGSMPIRRQIIMEIIRDSAPELIGANASEFKDAMKRIIKSSIVECAKSRP